MDVHAPGLTDGQHTVLTKETDGGGNTGSASLAFTLDTTALTISNILATPSGGELGIGNTVTITLTMSEPVTVVGTPTLKLSNGGTATYVSGADPSALVFSYTVVSTGQANI